MDSERERGNRPSAGRVSGVSVEWVAGGTP